VERNLTIRPGRVTLVIQVLAQIIGPIQITSDLEGSGRATRRSRKNFQRKYPNTSGVTWHRPLADDLRNIGGRQCHFAGTAAKISQTRVALNSWHRPLAENRRHWRAPMPRLTIGHCPKRHELLRETSEAQATQPSLCWGGQFVLLEEHRRRNFTSTCIAIVCVTLAGDQCPVPVNSSALPGCQMSHAKHHRPELRNRRRHL